MKANRRAIVAGISLCLLGFVMRATASTVPNEEIEFCDFHVPEDVARANASFTVVYSVEVNGEGRATSVRRAKNDFLQDEPFVSCLINWNLPVRNERVAVALTWKHGIGWTDVNISGQGVDQRIVFQQGYCHQYGSR